jgi:probable HAF family extracellular repeat protein
MRKKSILVLAMAVILLTSETLCNAIMYEIIDLGTLGGDESLAHNINDNGQIVGSAYTASGESNGCLYDPTGSGNNINLGSETAMCVNNHGQIVGWGATLFYPSGSNIDLGGLGGVWSAAYYINDIGQIVGQANTSSGDSHACLFYVNGLNVDIGTPGGRWSAAYSINNNGQIVGTDSYTSSGDDHACLFDPTGSYNNIDLGTLGGRWSDAYSINNNGQIVGRACTISEYSDDMHACLFDPSGSGNNIDLGALDGYGSAAYSINDYGQIVGGAGTASNRNHACLFDPTGSGNNIDLNTLLPPDCGWELEIARSINNDGWIVGHGYNPNGDYHAYLLIPEPATLLLLGFGAMMLRKKR